MNTRPQSRPRSTGLLQLAVCVIAFVIIAFILGHLNVGGLAQNGDQLTFMAAVAFVALFIVLRVQNAALRIERDVEIAQITARLDGAALQDRNLERLLGHDGYLARTASQHHDYIGGLLRRMIGVGEPQPQTRTITFPPASTGSSSSPGFSVTTSGGPPAAPAKRAPAKKAAPIKLGAKKAVAPAKKAVAPTKKAAAK